MKIHGLMLFLIFLLISCHQPVEPEYIPPAELNKLLDIKKQNLTRVIYDEHVIAETAMQTYVTTLIAVLREEGINIDIDVLLKVDTLFAVNCPYIVKEYGFFNQ